MKPHSTCKTKETIFDKMITKCKNTWHSLTKKSDESYDDAMSDVRDDFLSSAQKLSERMCQQSHREDEIIKKTWVDFINDIKYNKYFLKD